MKAIYSLLAITLSFSVFAAEPKPVKWKYVRAPHNAVPKGFIQDHVHDDEFAVGYVKQDVWKALPLEQKEHLVELDAHRWSEQQFDPKTLKPVVEISLNQLGPVEDYHTYTTLTAELKLIAEKFPKLVTLSTLGQTVDKRDIWMVELTDSETSDANKPKLFYGSSMHGDEVVGKEMLIYFIRDLIARYGREERVTQLLRNARLFIIPSINPDGTERKQRFNANGVDLNRDFPEMHEEAFATAGRAVETKHLMELHRKHHFQVSANFHTGALCVNLPWDHKANTGNQKFGDDLLAVALAKEYASHNSPMLEVSGGSFHEGVTYGYEWYQVLGGLQDWSNYFRNSTHSTMEVSNIKWPSSSTLSGFWSNNRESLLSYFEKGLFGVHLRVVDEQGSLVPNVGVDISTAKRTLTYDSFVHRPSVNSPQQVTLKAPGYATQVLTVNPVTFDGTYQTVVLRK